METLFVKNEITIHANTNHVWDALTNPEKTKKYMFGCEAISDWKPGSPLLWRGSHEGKEMIFVKGIVLEIIPNKRLKFTVIDPNIDMPDIPENYLNVTYELFENKGTTLLTVVQDGFEGAADGENRYQDVYNKGEGWKPVLVEIKKVVEAGLTTAP
jgi:uncharacterized protein YndB with AHSA1/START domain